MTRRKIILLSIPIIIFLIGLGGFLFLRSSYFLDNLLKTPLQQVIENQINDKYTAHIDKLSGDIFTGIKVEKFRIEERNTEKTPILSTAEIVLKYNFFGLLRRRFLVTSLEINVPEFDLRRNSEGEVNLTQVLRESSDKSDSSFTFDIANVSVNSGKILFADTENNILLSLPDITLKLNRKPEQSKHSGSIDFGRGSFSLDGKKLSIDTLGKKIQFSVSTDSGDLKEHNLRFGNSDLTISGDWADNLWKLDANLRFDAADIQSFLTDDLQINGNGNIALAVAGTNSTLSGTIIANVPKLSINRILNSIDTLENKTRQIDISDLTIDTTLDLAEKPNVILNNLNMQIANGDISGNGNMTFDTNSEGNVIERIQHFVKQPIFYFSNWEISEIQLNSLLTMFVEIPENAPQIESGILTGSALLTGDTSGNLKFDSDLQIMDTSLFVVPKSKQIFLQDSSLNCSVISGTQNESKISVDGMIDETSVNISGTYESLEVELREVDFGKLFEIFNSIPFKGIGKVSATVNKDATAYGHVEIPNASYDKDHIPLGQLAGDFRYQDNVMFFEDTYLTKKGVKGDTKVAIDGNVYVGNGFPAEFTIIAEKLVLDDEYNRIFFRQDYPIDGIIIGNLYLFDSLTSLGGKGNFTVDSGVAWDIKLDPLELALDIKDTSLTISDFKITSRGQLVTLNTYVNKKGDFEFSLKNSKNKPVQLAEIALAADIADFPFDGKMDIHLTSQLKKPNGPSTEVTIHVSELSFDGNQLGDGFVHGVLIEPEENTPEPSYFQFTGNAFENTSSIDGIIGISNGNPYQFTIKSEKIAATPILRIFHPTLEQITGTADSVVNIKGTIADLVPDKKEMDASRRIYPYVVDILVNDTDLEFNSLHFTNAKPVRIKIEDDIITFSESSLSVGQEQVPFIQLSGTIDAKTERINFTSKQNQDLTFNAFCKELGLPISGTASYLMKLTGTLPNPIVDVSWRIPTLVWSTEVGEIRIRNTDGEFNYENDTVNIKPFSMELLDNVVQVGGRLTINHDELDKSLLNLNINSNNINLVKFSDLVKNKLPAEIVNRLTVDGESLVQGNVDLLLSVNGNIAEPIIDIKSRSIDSQPIHLGAFGKPVIFDRIHAKAVIGSQLVHIEDIEVNGQIGDSYFQIDGDTTFSRLKKDEIKYNYTVSTEKLELSDFLSIYSSDSPSFNGRISATAQISGTGFTYDRIKATCKINELTIHNQEIKIRNISTVDFLIDNDRITTLFPLQLTSPILDTRIDISIDGPVITPNISVKWQGKLSNLRYKENNLPMLWSGNVDYTNELISVFTQITSNGHSLTLNGLIPFNLSLKQLDLSDRFLDAPIHVKLIGKELPLSFFPGVDAVFLEADGVADIDLALQGTTQRPYFNGNVFCEASKLRLNTLNQQLERVRLQLKASEDVIEFSNFEFGVEDGTCNLRKGELQIDGLTPKLLVIEGLTLTQYPLGSALQEIIPQDTLMDMFGNVTASLTKMKIPFDRFIQHLENIPIPRLVENMNFAGITQEAEAEFSFNNISLGFVALEQQYSFENPEPIPITLNAGTFRMKGLKLENNIPNPAGDGDVPLVFSCYGSWDMYGDIFANLQINNLNISTFDPFLSNEFINSYNKRGNLSTTVNITGAYASPNIVVFVEGENLGINQAQVDEFTGELTYHPLEQHWTISEENTQLRIGNNRLSCWGYIPFNISFIESRIEPIQEPMDIKFSLIIDELNKLQELEPLINSAKGEVTITGTITGTQNAPRLTGTGVMDVDSLSFTDTPVYFEDLESVFEFTESDIRIDRFIGQMNGGDFDAKGSITTNWLQINGVDLSASMRNSTFAESGKYQITVSSDNLHLSGMLVDTKLNGDIKIHSGQYRQNWSDVLDTFTAGTVTDSDLFSYAPILRDLTLNLGIDIPSNFRLISSTGGTTDIEIKCSGEMTGSLQAPIFTGNLSILKGKISTFTQIFEIQEGSTITNLSDKSFDPELNLHLKTRYPIRGVILSDGSTADFIISVFITGILPNGDPEKANVAIRAEPINSSTTEILTDAQILALLSPGNAFLLSFGGFTFTISPRFDQNQGHIIAEYPLPFGNNMSIKIEGGETGELGVDLQLLERRF